MYYVSPLNGVTPRINKFQLLELTTTATFSNYQVGWSSKWSFDSRLIHLFLSSLYILWLWIQLVNLSFLVIESYIIFIKQKNIPKKVASRNRKQLNLQPDHVDPLTVRRATSTSSGYSPDPSRHSHLP